MKKNLVKGQMLKKILEILKSVLNLWGGHHVSKIASRLFCFHEVQVHRDMVVRTACAAHGTPTRHSSKCWLGTKSNTGITRQMCDQCALCLCVDARAWAPSPAVCVCLWIYKHHIHTHTNTYIYIHIHVNIHIWPWVWVCIGVCTHDRICVCVYVYVRSGPPHPNAQT